MGETKGIELSKVAVGTTLLVLSATILVATGHLASPIPVFAVGAIPPALVAAMWIRTGETTHW